MNTSPLAADYVIVGAGAVGMAFADTLLTETTASMIIVDRRHAPGGHWIDAYPFVRLHGSSYIYGVNSAPLGAGRLDAVGLNRGLPERATAGEIVAYFDHVMQHRLLPSGRVQFLPMTDYGPDGTVRSRASGVRRQVVAHRKLVDATYADTRLPFTNAPPFPVAPTVRWVTPHTLPRLGMDAPGYVIVGAGKTAMDTAVWLLEQGVDPDVITWIRPRDAWLLNRANIQPRPDFFGSALQAMTSATEAARDASDLDDLFARLEISGNLMRIDRSVTPTMFRCAVVSEAELALLRRIRRVVRLGHVRAVEEDRIVLDGGTITIAPGSVHVHCAVSGIPKRASVPIFQDRRIVLQYVRRCAPTFSAALLAWLEATIDDDAARNALATPVPVPDAPRDWLRMQLQDARNQAAWSLAPGLPEWLGSVRMDGLPTMLAQATLEPSSAHAAIIERFRAARKPALRRMEQLLEGYAPVPARHPPLPESRVPLLAEAA